MKLSALLALLLAAPLQAQPRVRLAAAPRISLASPLVVIAPSAGLAAPAGLSALLAPSLVAPSITAFSEGLSGIQEALEKTSGAGAAHAAGRDLEDLLTGASSPAAADLPASPEELDFAAGASHGLALRADDLGAEKGFKSSRMSGADFLGLLEEARVSAPAAPSPAAGAAAREVEAQVLRVARALIPAEKPLSESVRRALAVWQVFDQELAVAASKGKLDAIVAEARLFASQVEESVAPADVPEPLAPAQVHPEDPEGYNAVSVPGSVFDWKPIAASPGHGFAPFDALIRAMLAEPKTPYAQGFEMKGAVSRSAAQVRFYGERHTDGTLIAANMARIVEDIRPKGKAIILVEGYTGWGLRGYAAIKYLAARGLDAEALAAKGVSSDSIEVRGWDVAAHYEESKHPLLQHHMNLLDLNGRAHGAERGWRYYRDFARAALETYRGWKTLWQAAVVVRNGDLDAAVARAAADAEETGASVHVIAGSAHLLENPRLAGRPLIGRPSLRRSLRRALGGRTYWASMPPNTLDP